MARTRQTARRSTGGMAPRAAMARDYSVSTQMSTYNETKTRTIEVLGEAEFDIAPDEAKLTFKIKERAYDVEDALKAVVEKLRDVRESLNKFGISNEEVTTDSVNIENEYEYVRVDENGEELEIIEKNKVEGDDSDDEEPFLLISRNKKKKVNEKEGEVKRYKKLNFFFCSTIVRIHLNKVTIENFSKTMFLCMTMGLTTHKAPVYDLSDFTEQREMVRTEATKNAYEKAKAMIEVLSEKVELGPPVLLRDIPLNVDDDADDSFEGQYSNKWWQSASSKAHEKLRAANEGDKKRKIESEENRFDFTAHLDDLFVVAPIRIMACVPIVFEIIPKKQTETEMEFPLTLKVKDF